MNLKTDYLFDLRTFFPLWFWPDVSSVLNQLCSVPVLVLGLVLVLVLALGGLVSDSVPEEVC